MEKIKQFVESEQGKGILSILIIILVALGSFGLGRLSKENAKPGILVKEYNLANVISAIESPNIDDKDITKSFTPKSSSLAKSYFASNRGTKYYSIGCSGGKTLKEENKVWFASKEEAENAGYELSSTCK